MELVAMAVGAQIGYGHFFSQEGKSHIYRLDSHPHHLEMDLGLNGVHVLVTGENSSYMRDSKFLYEIPHL